MSEDHFYRRALTLLLNPRFVTLLVVAGATVLVFGYFGKPLLPFFIALVLAYFLEGGVRRLVRWGRSRSLAVWIVYPLFLICYVLALLGPIQLTVRQALALGRNFPEIAARLQQVGLALPGYLAGIIPPDHQERLANLLADKLQGWGEAMLTATLASIPEVTTWAIYLFLIPLLVLFLLKDKAVLQAGVLRLLPRERELVEAIWVEVEERIDNYVRGKVWEIIIVGSVTWVVLLALGFEYPAMLGVLSGLSVLIPLVGAIGLAVPLAVLAFAQWGWGWDFGWVMIAYVVIQQLDANLLVPWIFSEAVKLHPLYIILGVIIFGSIWGFWGMFFAIPLATLAKAIINALLDLGARPSGAESP